MEGKLGGIVVALLIGGAVVWFKFSNKGDASDNQRAVAAAILMTIPGYFDNASDYDNYLETQHETAFESNFRMGGRMSGTTFDQEGYWDDLFDAMTAQAERERHKDHAEQLREAQRRMSR